MKRNVARAIRHRSNPRAPQFRISTLGPSREQSYLKYSAPSNWFLPRSNKRPRSDLDFERMEEKWRDLCFIIVATRRNTIGEKGNKVDKPEASGNIGVSLESALYRYETFVYMDVVISQARVRCPTFSRSRKERYWRVSRGISSIISSRRNKKVKWERRM